MGDHKRWYKFWTSLLSDDDFDPRRPGNLENIGRYAMLGAYIAEHGTSGVLEVMPDTLFGLMRVKDIDALRALQVFRNVSFEEGKNRYGKIVVTWQNWYTFQSDSTARERVKTLRSKRRGEEKRREESKTPLYPPTTDQDFEPPPRHQETGIQKIVNAYKISRGIPKDDKSWDKANFSRYSKSAKAMLECFGGDVQKSVAYVLLKADQFREKGLEYTLETLARHAYDAKGGREEVPADDVKKIEGGKNHAIPAVTLDEHRLLESRPGSGASQAGEDGPEEWD